MELRERIRVYLETRAVPVSRKELLSVASASGASRDAIYLVTKQMQDYPDLVEINIGIWWGYKQGGKQEGNETKTLWFHAHPLTNKEKTGRMVDLVWFYGLATKAV